MKKFILEEILLMSSSERKARRIEFDPRTTIILGSNDTGKSSLLKSIYWTFGAEAPDIHPDWKKARVVSLVKFSLDNSTYSILRTENFFALFDKDLKLIGTYQGVTKELAPKLSEIFDFKIKLNNDKGENVTLPPAYYFLPFYIDQDSSWNQNWSSFKNLSQVPRWRQALVEYHTGIKTNQYYVTKSEIDKIKLTINEVNQELNFYQGTISQLKKEVDSIDVTIDVNLFKDEIEDLVKDLQNLQHDREVFKSNLIDKYNLKNSLELQVNVVKSALLEVKKDYEFTMSHSEIDCPTCGQVYENSFADRFSIAKDQYKCADLLSELSLELLEVNKDINSLKVSHDENESKISNVNKILTTKKGKLSLNDVIKNEGKKQLKNFLNDKVNLLMQQITNQTILQRGLLNQQKDLANKDKERKTTIINSYHERMRSNLHELDVKKLGFDTYNKIDFKVTESGSDKPRALLAYYYSILNVMHDFTSTVFAPIIIDSPNQQDQDNESLKKMLNFIREKRIEDTQLILGLTDLNNIEFGGVTIKLEKKYSLMLENEYDQVFSMINPLLDKSLLS